MEHVTRPSITLFIAVRLPDGSVVAFPPEIAIEATFDGVSVELRTARESLLWVQYFLGYSRTCSAVVHCYYLASHKISNVGRYSALVACGLSVARAHVAALSATFGTIRTSRLHMFCSRSRWNTKTRAIRHLRAASAHRRWEILASRMLQGSSALMQVCRRHTL